MAKALFAVVVVDQAIDKPLDYAIPEELQEKAAVGKRVSVPVRGKLQKGSILEIKDSCSFPKVLPIHALLSDEILLSSDLLALGHWMAKYYATPLRRVMKALLPPAIRGGSQYKKQQWIRPQLKGQELLSTCELLRRKFPQQAKVLDLLLQAPKGMLLTEILEKGKISKSPIDQLIKKKILVSELIQIDRAALLDQEYFPTKPKRLHPEQKEALEKISTSLQSDQFAVHLVHGVTGSGKTEVYLQAIDCCLALNRGVILLVPEIALTSQIVEKLKGRFATKVALLHHRLSDGERHDAWHKIRNGITPIVIGARSAIFSPVPNLGLILVDEEHESSYKQTDEMPCYHARDVAVMRGKLSSATVVLGSATPSFESYLNALNGKYTLTTLKQRAEKATLPQILLIDMQREFAKKKGFTLFSDPLLTAIEKRLQLGEQSLLFLNRRGYHTAQVCSSCAHVIQCPNCDTNLTYHLGENLLACHLCDHRLSPPPRSCPECHNHESFKYKGAGTEMVERALHAIFPEIRTLRLDADTTRHKGSHQLLFKQFRAGKADLLIGTQMIAKGLHFPSVTLAAILNADASLTIPDFRSSEQVFQLITQVAGRAGRGALPGEVLIQTQMPDHPVIQAAMKQDYAAFYAQETEVRKLFDYPPFTYLVKVTLTGPSSPATLAAAQQLRTLTIQELPSHFQILPVVPCGHAKVKGNHRFQFLIKGPKRLPSLAFLKPPGPPLRLLLDIDPLSTFF
jgi:primosomal protein N' (replication factor Y)